MADKKKIGIVIADIDEYTPIEDYAVKNGGRVYTAMSHRAVEFECEGASVLGICSGIGKVNAAAAAMYIAKSGANIIFNIGYAGGISSVRRGQSIVGEKFLEHDFDLTTIGYAFAEKPSQEYIYSADENLASILKKNLNINGGVVVTGDRFVNDAVLRDTLKDNFGANACDMEAAAVAYVAKSMDIPFACVKIISDDAGDNALEDYREMNTNEGESLCSIAVKCLDALSKG